MGSSRRWDGYAWAAGAAAICTVAGFAMRPRFDLVNVAMVYLLGVLFVARRYPRGPAVFASVLGIVAFDVLFVHPQGSLTVEDAQYLLTFAIMLAVAFVVSGLVESTRRKAEEQAALTIQAETERIRSALLASISHDLRTPLAVLTGASSSLVESGERLDPAERLALARSVYEQSREISERVAKVLEMTRLETGSIRLERDWASLAEIAASALDQVGERLAAHRLLLELPEDLPLVRVDASLIAQALANLLENAARHTPAGTVVRLRAACRADEVVLTVEDHARGAPEIDVARAFEKFHHGSSGTAGRGVGLGLAICAAIVRLHGGRTWAEHVSGGGTAFHIALALEPAPQMPADAHAASQPP